MKILLATMQYGHGYGQGTERYVAMLADGLIARGHEVVILGGDPEQRGRATQLGDIVAHHPTVRHYPSSGWTAVRGMPPERFTDLLEAETPDLVHVTNPAHIGVGLLEAAQRCGLPTACTVVDYWWLCPKHILLHRSGQVCDAQVPWTECVRCIAAMDPRPLPSTLAQLPVLGTAALAKLYALKAFARGTPINELLRWTRRQPYLLNVMSRADAVIFLSRFAQETIGRHLRPGRCHLIPVGMEPRWFELERAAGPDAALRSPESLTLGYVGALVPHKGVDVLLDALHLMDWHQTRVKIVGGGPDGAYRRKLHDLAAGLNVEFVGSVPTGEMPALLASLDLLVVPSLWPENQPQTVLEALASGTPVIGSNVAGITEVIRDEGMSFAPNSAEALAACLRDWARSPRGNQRAAEIPTAADMVARTIGLYERLCQVD